MLLALVPFSVPAGAGDDEQVTVSATEYVMPAGEHTGGGSAAAPEAVPLLMPVGDAAYRKLKDDIAKLPATGGEDRGLAAEAGQGGRTVVLPTCFNDQFSTGSAPSNVHGAVGLPNMVVVANSKVGVFNRSTCAVVSLVALSNFFAPVGVVANTALFDPQVIRDPLTGRFFLSAISQSQTNDQDQYYAVSKDGLGTSWWLYKIVLSRTSPVVVFCKKSQLGRWHDPRNGASNLRWFITANDLGPSSNTSAVLTINKAPTLSGGAATVRCFKTPTVNLAPPIVHDLSAVSTFLRTGAGAGTVLKRHDYVTSPVAHSFDTMNVRPDYDIIDWIAPPDARQPNLQKLDSLDGRFQSASTQVKGQIWNIHSINILTLGIGNKPGLRMYRLGNSSTTSSPVFNTKSIPCTQSPCDDQINPSLATSAAVGAPLFITFTRTNKDLAVQLGRAAHVMLRTNNTFTAAFSTNTLATSPTQFTQDCLATCVPCNSAPGGACRWAGSSATQLDPSDVAIGWGWNQLARNINSAAWSIAAGRRN